MAKKRIQRQHVHILKIRGQNQPSHTLPHHSHHLQIQIHNNSALYQLDVLIGYQLNM